MTTDWIRRPLRAGPASRLLAASALLMSAAPFAHGLERPEPPAIERDIARARVDPDGVVRFSSPQIAPHRTSADGRIGVQVQGGGPEVRFYLFVPEKLTRPVLDEDPGAKILGSHQAYSLPFPPPGIEYPDNGVDYLTPFPIRTTGHHALCDPTTEFSRPGEVTNPFPCPSNPSNDCYDLTLINNTVHFGGAQMWGTPVHVEVAQPKTPEASIVSIEMGAPVAGKFLEQCLEWTEPMITRDGRLLTGRIGIIPLRTWTNPETGETRTELYDIMYSQLPDDADPCDVTGWQDFHPISHAPFDSRMKGRYGIAAYPFRDGEGNLVPDGSEIGGSYPWVDETGANLFLTAVPERLADQPDGVFPARCAVDGCEGEQAFVEPESHDVGFAVAGLWTHGKLVMLDGLINHTDWQVPVDPDGHSFVELYRTPENAPVEVRVGSGRALGRQTPSGFSGNPNILHSIENLFNHQQNLHALTPRDVVWVMSTGVSTDEVDFDDWLNPDGFIVSNMQPSITPEFYLLGGETIGGIAAFMRYHNGKRWTPERRYDLDIHIQNAGTALPDRWAVPPYGLVRAETGRIEPVALGGIRGKGFWLDGENAVEYEIPVQPRNVADHDWYMGIFVDPRSEDRTPRELLRFPDGTGVWLVGRNEVQYRARGQQPTPLLALRGAAGPLLGSARRPSSRSRPNLLRSVELPTRSDTGWVHLGWNLTNGGREAVLFVDGFAFDRFVSREPIFQLEPGTLYVGKTPGDRPGFRGWIDELKVFAQTAPLEVACNHAYGTLIDVGNNAEWRDFAARYPLEHHVALAGVLGTTTGTPRYACFHDHTGDSFAHSRNVPEGSWSLRESLNFPEGPLRMGAPRPDSSQNEFCLSCHHPDGQMGLGTDALEYQPETTAEEDPRRQPLQALRRVFGNIPAGWIEPGAGPGSPLAPLRAPAEGLLVDQWVLSPSVGPGS